MLAPKVEAEARLVQGDALTLLRQLPDDSIATVVTSPPYWGLRDYGASGQLGLERTPDEYVAKMTEIFEEVRRVLVRHGTLWLNMGDCYMSDGGAGRQGARGIRANRKQTHSAMPQRIASVH